jgi:hypothetical protein
MLKTIKTLCYLAFTGILTLSKKPEAGTSRGVKPNFESSASAISPHRPREQPHRDCGDTFTRRDRQDASLQFEDRLGSAHWAAKKVGAFARIGAARVYYFHHAPSHPAIRPMAGGRSRFPRRVGCERRAGITPPLQSSARQVVARVPGLSPKQNSLT